MAASSSPSTSSRSLLATRPLFSPTRTRTRRPPPSTSTSTSTSTSIPPRLSCLRPPSTYFYSYSSPSASASVYNGWADLAAAPDTPFPFPFPLQPTTHGLLVLLPTAALALSLSLARLPPLPILAAAFTAGFAARHLSSSAQPESPRRLSALLADLDAQARALRDELLSDARPGLLVQAVDRLRDAVADAATVAAQQGHTGRTVSDALGPLWEVADYLGAWARHAVRDLSLSSPRKKPAKSNNTSDVANPNNQATAAAAAAQQQQEIGNNKPADSTLQQEPFAFGPSIVDNANGRPLDMLQFDEDDNGSKDAGTGAQATLGVGDARLERLVSKHRHRRDSVQNDGPFQGGSTRFSAESMESSLLERTLEIRDRSYRFKIERRGGDGVSQMARSSAETSRKPQRS